MIQKPKSSALYTAEGLTALRQTGITQTSPGGKARAITDFISDKMSEIELKQFSNLAQTLLPYATGDLLDFIGAYYQTPRIQRQDATVPETDNNFQFAVRYGTFGSINGGKDIVVPAGTKIYTDDDNGPVFLTQYDVALPADQSFVFFAAVSAQPGASGSTAAGVFTRHSFSGYADARYGSLLVTNNLGVTAGRDTEDDDSYRYRISLKMQSRGGSREDDLREAVLRVAGVQDVDFERKAGIYIAYVYGISPAVPPSLLADVQTTLNELTAFPGRGLAVAPDLVGISLDATLTLAPGTTSQDAPIILAMAASAAQTYVDNLNKGQTLVLNQIADQILQTDRRILDIGQPDKPLDNVYIWRSRSDGTRYSRFLVGNYTPALGERIVTENIASAISLTQA